jgi:asparagine synthase (glutamine-hydrolysing)
MPTLRSEVATTARSARRIWHDEWVVRFDPDRVSSTASGGGDISGAFSAASPLVIAGAEGSDVAVACTPPIEVVVAGILTNARELADDPTRTAAHIVGQLFAEGGVDAFARLRGSFAAIVWDGARRRLHVARDQVGLQPLFVARSEGRWHFAGAPQMLVSLPGVSRAIDAVALSEWICGWYPAIEDTAYRDVKRVPPATVTTFCGEEVVQRRYWDPSPITEPIAWSREEDLEAFEGLLTRAVERALGVNGAPAIFLSGGVDSITIAAAAADIRRAAALAPPLALSLVFPDAASNEEAVQTAVARELGLPQRLVPLGEAAGSNGLLAAALELSASWPQPMWNIWSPAYMHLARVAAGEGAGVVLTGRGGDEWLTVTPYLMADLAARGDVAGIWRMLQTWRRSHVSLGLKGSARLLWNTAGRPLASAALDTVAHRPWHARRRRRLLRERPAWVAPDPAIRAAMDARIERWIDPARPPQGFYVREMRTALFHPGITHDMEETQEFGRRNGQRMLHPFWDVDLVNALYRVPPDLLMRDGRSKWLLRRRLEARLPGLGLEGRTKVSAGGVFTGMMAREARAAWDGLGGLQTLTEAGILSGLRAESASPSLAELVRSGAGRLWAMLTLEAWARHRR